MMEDYELCGLTKFAMNIELKSPRNLLIRKRYNTDKVVDRVMEEIKRYAAADYCMIQSFDHELLLKFENYTQPSELPLKTLYLQSFYYDVEPSPLD